MVSGTGEGKIGSLKNIELPFTRWKSSEFSCTTAWIYLILPHYILQMVKIVNFMLCNLCVCVCVCVCVCSVLINTLQSHALGPSRLLGPSNFPGKYTGAGCHFLLQGIFPIQGLNLCLLHWQADALPLHHMGSPFVCFIPIFFLFFLLYNIALVLPHINMSPP